MGEPTTMSRLEFEELCQNELAACDDMLQRLEDEYNSPERVARRDMIAKHIGRPLFRDDLPSTKVADVGREELKIRIALYNRLGYSLAADEIEKHMKESDE